MDYKVLSRPALGTTAFLGDLYNCRSDEFCGTNIFQNVVPSSALFTLDSCDSNICVVSSQSKIFDKLDICLELQASILTGLTKTDNSCNFLRVKNNSTRSMSMSLIYRVKTKEEKLNIHHSDLIGLFAHEAIKNEMATHAVGGIDWGVVTVVTLCCKIKENQNKTETAQKLNAVMEQLKFLVSGETQPKSNNDMMFPPGLNIKVRVYSNLVPPNEKSPITFEAVPQFLSKLPKLVEICNNGKGKPIMYKLLPLSVIRTYLGMEAAVHNKINSIDAVSLLRIIQLLEEIATSLHLLNDFCKNVQAYSFCIPAKSMKEIRDFEKQMIILESSLKAQMAGLLVNIRSGIEDAEKMEAIMQRLYASELSNETIKSKLDTWSDVAARTKFARILKNAGIKFLQNDEKLADKFLELRDRVVYVLFYSYNAQSAYPEVWRKNTHLFLKEKQHSSKNSEFFAVDYGICTVSKPPNQHICVQVFEEGRCVAENLFGETTELEQLLSSVPAKITWVSDSSANLQGGVNRYAVLGGMDPNGNPTYVCRAFIEGKGLVPGSLVVTGTSKTAHIPFDIEYIKNSFEVLVCPPWGVSWEKVSDDGEVPDNAIIVAAEFDNDRVCIGRASYLGGIVVGKARSSDLPWPGFWFCYDNKEQHMDNNFEVLVRNQMGMQHNI